MNLRSLFVLGTALLLVGCSSSHRYAAPPPLPPPQAAPAPVPPPSYAPPPAYVPPPAPVPPSASPAVPVAPESAPVASQTSDTASAVQPPSAGGSAAVAPLSPSAREILRLKDAGYSEDFLLNKVRSENANYRLTIDDLIALRQAGLSETLIDAMLRSGSAPSPASAAVPMQPVARHAEFDGLVRQKRGVFGVGGSKNKLVGKLVIDSERVNWYQMIDADDNFSMAEKNIKEMWLNCAPRAGENLCLEVCFKTYSGDEWCYRDTGWGNGDNRQVTAVFDYFQKAFPATFFSKREKKSF